MSPLETEIRRESYIWGWGSGSCSAAEAERHFTQRWANSRQRKELAENGQEVLSHSFIREIKKADKIIRKNIGIALLDPNPYIRKYALLITEHDHLKWTKTKNQSYQEAEVVNKISIPIPISRTKEDG